MLPSTFKFLQYEYLKFHVKPNLYENKLPERMPSNFEIINKLRYQKQNTLVSAQILFRMYLYEDRALGNEKIEIQIRFLNLKLIYHNILFFSGQSSFPIKQP